MNNKMFEVESKRINLQSVVIRLLVILADISRYIVRISVCKL